VGGKNIFWFFIFSISLTVLLIHVNSKKEWEGRIRMAEKLGLQTDPGAENLLSIALQNFRTDFLRENFYRLKTSGTNQFLKDSILNEHFSGYLNKFETEIFTFDEAEQPLYNADSATFNSLNTIYNLQSKQTSVRDWRYYEESFDKFYYLAKKEVTDTTTKKNLGYLFILSRPKRFTDQKFYPELFSKTYNLQTDNSPFYAYAIYKNKKLINHFNDYQFPIQLGTEEYDQPGFFEKKRNGYSELWYNISNDATVVIAKDENRVLETITLFAYLFFVFLIMGASYSVIQFLSKVHWRLAALKEQLQFTFRTQVHATIIGISVLSFLIIGVSTIFFFINRHNRNNKERLSRTIQIMNDEVEQALKDHLVFDDVLKLYDDIISAELQAKVNRISEIHGVDVNIYDPNGSLRISSQPYYYIKGVLSRKINPAAYYTLSKERFIQTIEEEQVGSRSYMSIYAPVRDVEGIAYAYINIPYFTSQNELKQEISNFLVTLINLNAFIFLIAGLIAFFVTSRITNSFLIISEKLKEIKLGKTNEAIVWHRNDEIGELVQEYNKMVLKLEDSAKLLARSEREGAWREMARQVAHEIKNPLTPMKLSIQYLQKAIDSNSPDAKPISQSVAKTLVEQIDYLSNIASDFSNFANIGNPVMEKVNLSESIQSVVDLFSMEENGSISYEKSKEEIFVMADKTQLNRLFTNLIRNAFESASGTYKAEVQIQCTLSKNKVLIKITDNGEGIKTEMKDKIFYPNFTTKTSGTGLGLAMCKSIVEQMKGEIWFETETGKGSTFFVELTTLG
jgi:signal transduction histidine kinase